MTVQERKSTKESIDRLHKKFYGPEAQGKKVAVISDSPDLMLRKKAERVAIIDAAKPSPKEGIRMAAGSTRAELMQVCKEKGIKNYRVINKEEMVDILAHIGEPAYIDKVVAGAVARWKQGWGAKSREAGKDHKE